MRRLLLSGWIGLLPALALAQDAPDRAAILAAVDRYFLAMHARDSARMDAANHPGASTVAVSYHTGQGSVGRGPTSRGHGAIARLADAPREWLLAAEVWQDGDLALVWAPYEIRLGTRLLHCGFDAFHMVRARGEWRIGSTAYTARPNGCVEVRAAAMGPRPLPAPSDADRAAVLATVDQFFDALETRDTSALRPLFSPAAAWLIVAERDGETTIGRRAAAEDFPRFAAATEPYRERFFDTTVRVDGDLAIVWGPYRFAIGDRLSHCGHDAFTLVRVEGRWLLEGGSFTVRPEICPSFLTPRQVDSLPSRPADTRRAYGQAGAQWGELRLPEGAGPFPVAVIVHGGCWQRRFASAENTAAFADALRDLGIATWNVEYRTADEPGGGWPGTFHDVSDAVDYVRVLARSHPLDTTRVLTVGHSAGGHLALWAAARGRQPAGSALLRGEPLRVAGAVALGPVMDLAAFAGENSCSRGVGLLMGGTPDAVPARYAAGAPMALLPLGVPHAIVVGALDGVLPTVHRERYARAARSAGDAVSIDVIPWAGHFEVLAPQTPGWNVVIDAIRRLLPPPR